MRDHEIELISKHHKKSKKHKSHGISKKSKKSHYEMVAMTAYFKRAPKPDQNAFLMLEEQNKKRMSRDVPQVQKNAPGPVPAAPFVKSVPSPNGPAPVNPQQFNPQKPAHVIKANKDLPEQPRAMEPERMEFPKPPPTKLPHLDSMSQPKGLHPQGKLQQEKPLQGKQEQRPNIQQDPDLIIETITVHKPPSTSSRHIPDSPRSSRDSFDSRSRSSRESSTSASSVSSGPAHRKHHRGRSRTPVFRNEDTISTPARKHSRHEERDYSPMEMPRKHADVLWASKTSSRDSVRDSAYPGVHDQHNRYDTRHAPPPYIVQASPGIRRMTREEVRREVLQDDLDRTEDRIRRMHLNDSHPGQDRVLNDQRLDRLAEELQHRRSLIEELEDYAEREAAEYMRERAFEHSQPQGRRQSSQKYYN
ncbi:hypothetical protein BGZ63DRAFT_388977 [Mariannaea sp. PMI_226]|nr:hypothetical protein BGZ63DRAFT_388977 [Mariannaea sp. PMI_226]